MIISTDSEKAFNKSQYLPMIKALNRGQKNVIQHKKVIYDIPTANLMLIDEMLTAFLQKSLTVIQPSNRNPG